MKLLVSTLIALLFLTGCNAQQINRALESSERREDRLKMETYQAYLAQYRNVSQQIAVGDTKARVLQLLTPLRTYPSVELMRAPEKYTAANGAAVEVYFPRTAHIPDNRFTDDEVTPHIFVNDVLFSVGWSMLGGAKTEGKMPQQNVIIRQYQDDGPLMQPMFQMPTFPSTTICNGAGNSVYCREY